MHMSLLAAFAAAAALLSGCAPNFTDFDQFSLYDGARYAEDNTYVIEPPDVVRIIAPNTPELNNITQVVRPDGRLTLYPMGDFLAAGLTPAQLSQTLEDAARQVFLDVEIQVQVVSANSKVVYVMGQVSRQGPQSYRGTETFLDAMARSVPLTTAWHDRIQLHRRDPETGEVYSVTLNYIEMVEQGKLEQDFVLHEGDIIYVPPNPFAAVGFAIQNLVFPVDPALRMAGVPRSAVQATDISDTNR
ncbi:MAG: polysaccharide biosynthesis/export family protein [Phycisphaerales bacterium]|nr:polysaccharide biosynthesis/export family protein [Phycisphaerales bacterium]